MEISAINLQYDTFLHIFMPQHLKSYYVQSRSQSTIFEHQNIIRSLQAGDIEKTRQAIERHINTSVQLALSSNDPVMTANV
jgi:DNA-binding GntR family transcriptional regulator